jgi:hypothetical protein
MTSVSEAKGGRTGWVGYGAGPHGKDHLPPDVRVAVEHRERELAEQRGPLLCEVHVQVYARDVANADAMWVSFPAGSALGPDSDPAEVATAVERARQALARWR